MKTNHLIKINNANIYCTVRGNGTPILLVHGAGCDSDFFEDSASILSQNYKVITYDRRGYSRSNGEVDGNFLDISAHDIKEILSQLIPNEKVIVVGCSAGALIAMRFEELYPKFTSLIIAHEPPMLSLLPTNHDATEVLNKVNEFIDLKKYGRASNRFYLLMEESEENVKQKSEETMIREETNMKYFMKYEFKDTFDKTLSFTFSSNSKIVIGAGDAHRENYHFIYARNYANEHHIPFVHFPGKHNCAYDLPIDFAITIQGIIQTFKANEN